MIYLDHAATSPMSRPVLEAMWPYMSEVFANPSSTHAMGREARAGLEAARADIARVFGASPGEVLFTSGGTEGDNLAIFGTALARPRGRHIVTTPIEHPAALEACEALQRQHDFELSIVPVDSNGLVDMEALVNTLRPDTTLCSVMYANNEVGTVQPIVEIAQHCRNLGVRFHVDAVQAPGYLSLDVSELGVDTLSISAHKFGGPRGIGALYVRDGLPLAPRLFGGSQERGQRPGTENVAGAVGMAVALDLAEQARPTTMAELTQLRDNLIEGVLEAVPEATLTGHPRQRLCNLASFCFRDVHGETVLQELEMSGVCCSSGSACAAGSDDPSHVLLAMGYDAELATTAVRFSLGPSTTSQDVDYVLEALPRAINAIRAQGIRTS